MNSGRGWASNILTLTMPCNQDESFKSVWNY